MHTSAKDIIAHRTNGELDKAYEVFTKQTQPSLQKLQAGLASVRKTIEEAQTADEAEFARYLGEFTIKVGIFAAFLVVMMVVLVLFLHNRVLVL